MLKQCAERKKATRTDVIVEGIKLVKSRREGKTVYYSLADAHVETILSQGLEHVQE